MKKIEFWEAEDGERFETEAECLAHENRFAELSEKIKFFNANYELMTEDFLYDAEQCYAMYIPTNEIAEKLHEVLKEEDIEDPFDIDYNREPKSGHYFYKGRWCCLEEEWAKLKVIEENFNKARGLI